MTELDVILEDIRTNPADDLPRLALADWLMEQDDPFSRSHGEFIHSRCRAAALPPRDPERARLQKRALDLRDRDEREWLGDLADRLDSWDFDRGMILAELSADSLTRSPLRRLTSCTAWKWVLGVRITGTNGRLITPLFRTRHLANLTTLTLSDCEIATDGARELARSRYTKRLVSLDLGYAQLGDQGAAALAASRHLDSLRILKICNNTITPEGAVALSATATLTQLETLDMSRNPISDRGVVALAAVPRNALRQLGLASCNLTDRGALALALSPNFPNLERLDLSDNRLRSSTGDELRERLGKRVLLG